MAWMLFKPYQWGKLKLDLMLRGYCAEAILAIWTDQYIDWLAASLNGVCLSTYWFLLWMERVNLWTLVAKSRKRCDNHSAKGQMKRWVTSQQWSPGQHLFSDCTEREREMRPISCSTSCVTVTASMLFCSFSVNNTVFIDLSLPLSSNAGVKYDM